VSVSLILAKLAQTSPNWLFWPFLAKLAQTSLNCPTLARLDQTGPNWPKLAKLAKSMLILPLVDAQRGLKASPGSGRPSSPSATYVAEGCGR